METKSDEWLNILEEHVKELSEVPLWGYPPPFPWDEVSQEICQLLEFSSFKISLRRTEWIPFQELLGGCGEEPLQIPIELAPLAEPMIWVMGREMIETFSLLALTSTENPLTWELQEGFYRFFCLEVLHILANKNCFADLNPQVAALAPLPEEGAMCLEIAIEANGKTMWGRLICPSAFTEVFKRHFSLNKPTTLELARGKKIELALPLVIGDVQLTTDAWGKIEEGDFIILDRCSYDPEKKEGQGAFGPHSVELGEAQGKILKKGEE